MARIKQLMKKMMFSGFFMILVIAVVVAAHESEASGQAAPEHDYAATKKLIDSNLSCDQLSQEQLETIGEYYMEQMHPGEAHELMDEMMGGESSDSLKQMHIQMAKKLYCHEDVGEMMGGGAGSMMGSDMMNTMMGGGNMMGSGMMGNAGMMNSYFGSVSILYYLLVALLLALLILAVLWIIRTWRDLRAKGKHFKNDP